MKEITIYTDGAARGNPGPGGYGVILKYLDHRKEFSQGFRNTTNNRMELRAVIVGLKALKEPCNVTVYSDSKYITDAINKGWLFNWESRGYVRKGNKPLLNSDLWKELRKLLNIHNVDFKWVRGHDGNIDNEKCDYLATAAADSNNLEIDEGFEKKEKVKIE